MNVVRVHNRAHTQGAVVLAGSGVQRGGVARPSRGAGGGLVCAAQRAYVGVGGHCGAGVDNRLEAHAAVLLDGDRQQYEVTLCERKRKGKKENGQIRVWKRREMN